MTDPARAAVEAWMWEDCPHSLALKTFLRSKQKCPDCLLAFVAAHRAEENEECERILRGLSGYGAVADLLRARRQGP